MFINVINDLITLFAVQLLYERDKKNKNAELITAVFNKAQFFHVA